VDQERKGEFKKWDETLRQAEVKQESIGVLLPGRGNYHKYRNTYTHLGLKPFSRAKKEWGAREVGGRTTKHLQNVHVNVFVVPDLRGKSWKFE